MTDALPTLAIDDAVARITMDDGKANVFSNAVLEALEGHLDAIEAEGARALVLVGRPGRFSAGFDLAEMTASVEGMRALVARGARFWLRLYGLGVPTVAASTGHALAGGAITLLSCDVRLAADVPAKVGLSEVSIGMVLPKFATELARDRIVKSHLAAATIAGTVFDVHGALAAGFIDRIVPEAELLEAAQAEAARLGALRTGAYAGTKQNLRGQMIERVLAEVDADLATFDLPPT